MGEKGMGKSKVLEWLRRRLRGEGFHKTVWLRGRVHVGEKTKRTEGFAWKDCEITTWIFRGFFVCRGRKCSSIDARLLSSRELFEQRLRPFELSELSTTNNHKHLCASWTQAILIKITLMLSLLPPEAHFTFHHPDSHRIRISLINLLIVLNIPIHCVILASSFPH